MARRISRRAVSSHVAERLLAGDFEVIKALAAYLIETRQTRNVELFVRDIESVMLAKGHAIVDVTAAFELADKTKAEIAKFVTEKTNANNVEIRESVDPSVIGGLKLQLPGKEMDATIARHLTVLKTRFKKA